MGVYISLIFMLLGILLLLEGFVNFKDNVVLNVIKIIAGFFVVLNPFLSSMITLSLVGLFIAILGLTYLYYELVDN